MPLASSNLAGAPTSTAFQKVYLFIHPLAGVGINLILKNNFINANAKGGRRGAFRLRA